MWYAKVTQNRLDTSTGGIAECKYLINPTQSPTNHPTAHFTMFATHIKPPYYAVIFTSTRTPGENGYDATADRMGKLAAQQPGYIGIESARGASGLGITVSYWRSLEDIKAWKAVAEHGRAQKKGKEQWYEHYNVRIAHVERAYAKL